jgi:hypothetical protein
MRQWAFNPQAQAELRAEVGRELGVDDAFMAHVHRRQPYYRIHASILFPTLAAYIDATRDIYNDSTSQTCARVRPRTPPLRPPTASAAARRSRPSAPPPRLPRRSITF